MNPFGLGADGCCGVFCFALELAMESCFCCCLGGGRLNDCCSCLDCLPCSGAVFAVWLCILAPAAVFIFVALPYFLSQLPTMVCMVPLLCLVLALIFLTLACCADPGIIPRREVILATHSEKIVEEALGYNPLGIPHTEGGETEMTIPDEMKREGYRWCRICRIYRPPRATHCPECDNCVLHWDHHCPFVNNCIGRRNYAYFLGFVTSACCMAAWGLPLLVWYFLIGSPHVLVPELQAAAGAANEAVAADIARAAAEVAELVSANATAVNATAAAADPWLFSARPSRGSTVFIALATAVLALLVLVPWSYHVFLILSGLTTKEHLTRKWGASGTSFAEDAEEGLTTLLAPQVPRLFNPRELVDVRLLQREVERRLKPGWPWNSM